MVGWYCESFRFIWARQSISQLPQARYKYLLALCTFNILPNFYIDYKLKIIWPSAISYSPRHPSSAMDSPTCMQLLQVALGLPFTGDFSTETRIDPLDVVLVSIDFENGRWIKSCAVTGALGDKQCQAGISIFDTKTLSSPSALQEGTLKTFNIGVGKHSPSSKGRFNHRFLFGEMRFLKLGDLSDFMDKFIDRTRNIILVGHNPHGDLNVLQALGFDLKTSIIGVLDTEMIANIVLGPSVVRGTRRLRDVLAQLGCHFEGFHSAGNDANFTLRALLLLAAEHYAGLENLDACTQQRLKRIKSIGHSPVPCPSQASRRQDEPIETLNSFT